jgi:hypothetical protein
MLGSQASNPFGHYEDTEILNFHKQILVRQFGHTMWVPSAATTSEYDKVIARKLLEHRERNAQWGWKEPRTSLFLDFWSQLLPRANYLFVVRHPALVLDSLARRTKSDWYQIWKHNRFLRGWLVYNQACFDFYKQHKNQSILVVLEKVLTAPERFAALLSSRLKMTFSADVFRKQYVESAVKRKPTNRWLSSPALRRHTIEQFHELMLNADD